MLQENVFHATEVVGGASKIYWGGGFSPLSPHGSYAYGGY